MKLRFVPYCSSGNLYISPYFSGLSIGGTYFGMKNSIVTYLNFELTKLKTSNWPNRWVNWITALSHQYGEISAESRA